MPDRQKQRPPEVKAALKAIKIYEQEPSCKDEDLAFFKARLPALALHMGEHDPEILLSHIRKGKEHLETLLDKHHKKRGPKKRTYESVVHNLKPIGQRFLDAVKEGDLDLLKTFIKEGIGRRYNSRGAIYYAIENEHLDVLRFLIEEQGLRIVWSDLCLVKNHNSLDIIRYLKSQDCGFEYNKETILRQAVMSDNLALTKYLIKEGANIQACYGGAIEQAAANGRLKTLRYLLEKGLYIYNSQMERAITEAAASGELDFIKFCIDRFDEDELLSEWFIEKHEDEDLSVLETVMLQALYGGHYKIFDYLYTQYSDQVDSSRYVDSSHYYVAAVTAAERGDMDELKRYLKEADYDKDLLAEAFDGSVRKGQLDTARYLLEEIPQLISENENAAWKLGAFIAEQLEIESILSIAERGDLDMFDFLIQNDIEFCDDIWLYSAVRNGHIDFIDYAIKQGADPRGFLDQAILERRLDVIKYLLEPDLNDDDYAHIDEITLEDKNKHLSWAIRNDSYEMADYFIKKGADIEELREGVWAEYECYQNYLLWRKVHSEEDLKCFGTSLFIYSPYHVKPKVFRAVVKMLEHEGYEGAILDAYAYNIASLFGSEDRVLRYLEKWGEDDIQPLHDICHMLEWQQEADPDLKAWADAILQHGPKMAKLLRFAEQLPQPAKDAASKGWSYTKTAQLVAQYAYDNGPKNPELAKICTDCNYSEHGFNKALKQIDKYQKRYAANDNKKKEDLIPDIKIDGSKFGKKGYRFYKLPDGDLRGLLLGEFTNCCQHIAGEGSSCAKHGFLSEFGGFYVIADKKSDQIIGQSWVWRGKKGELCFDSLESLGDHFNKKSWQKLMNVFADKVEKTNTANISAIHVGTGGATPHLAFDDDKEIAVPAGSYKGYRDSESQYLVRKLS